MNAPFRVETEADQNLRTVSVFGELDQATAPRLRSELGKAVDEPDTAILVDLSDCDFIDSTGLSLLVEAKRRLAEAERGFGVCCPDADVRRLLELTGIDDAVGLFHSRDEAVAVLNGSATA